MALCFCVRIGVRGGAETRLRARSIPRTQQPQKFLTFLKAEGGAGGGRQKVERKFLGVASQWHTGLVYHHMQSLGIHFLHIACYYHGRHNKN